MTEEVWPDYHFHNEVSLLTEKCNWRVVLLLLKGIFHTLKQWPQQTFFSQDYTPTRTKRKEAIRKKLFSCYKFCQNTEPGMFHEARAIGLTFQSKNILYTKNTTENYSYFERTINIILFAGWILIVTVTYAKTFYKQQYFFISQNVYMPFENSL